MSISLRCPYSGTAVSVERYSIYGGSQWSQRSGGLFMDVHSGVLTEVCDREKLSYYRGGLFVEASVN